MRHTLKLFIVAIGLVSLLAVSKKENSGLKKLVFENVEALANDEGSNIWCISDGSLDCNGEKVKYIYPGLR